MVTTRTSDLKAFVAKAWSSLYTGVQGGFVGDPTSLACDRLVTFLLTGLSIIQDFGIFDFSVNISANLLQSAEIFKFPIILIFPLTYQRPPIILNFQQPVSLWLAKDIACHIILSGYPLICGVPHRILDIQHFWWQKIILVSSEISNILHA